MELPPTSADSTALAFRLCRLLSNFGIYHNLGEAYTEMRFKLPLKKDRNRKPDAAFVSYAQWAKDTPIPSTNAWDVLPALCVEVVSPNDKADEIETKVNEYFEAGVRLVWIVYPRHERVYIYDSATQVRRLTRADSLEGGAAVPGFAVPFHKRRLNNAQPVLPVPCPVARVKLRIDRQRGRATCPFVRLAAFPLLVR